MRLKWSWVNLRHSGTARDHDKYEDTLVGITTKTRTAIIRTDVTIITDCSVPQQEFPQRPTLRVSETENKQQFIVE